MVVIAGGTIDGPEERRVMSSKRKKRIRARSAATGKSHQGVLNARAKEKKQREAASDPVTKLVDVSQSLLPVPKAVEKLKALGLSDAQRARAMHANRPKSMLKQIMDQMTAPDFDPVAAEAADPLFGLKATAAVKASTFLKETITEAVPKLTQAERDELDAYEEKQFASGPTETGATTMKQVVDGLVDVVNMEPIKQVFAALGAWAENMRANAERTATPEQLKAMDEARAKQWPLFGAASKAVKEIRDITAADLFPVPKLPPTR